MSAMPTGRPGCATVLFREARSAGSLNHPSIVTIYDAGEDSARAFIAMERVEGPTLQAILASGWVTDRATLLGILDQSAEALDFAHENGIVHRDIKPANIAMHRNSRVKITDFGIAKVLATQHSTKTGLVMGTPSYMSPEQIKAQPLDGRYVHSLHALGAPPRRAVGKSRIPVFCECLFERVDHFVLRHLGPRAYCRYVDDFLLFHEEKPFLHARQAIQRQLNLLRLRTIAAWCA